MTKSADAPDTRFLRVVWASVLFTAAYALACSRWSGSDGRTAAVLDALNLVGFGVYTAKTHNRPFRNVLWAAGAFGVVELVADDLCVRCTGTLDYSVAHSALLFVSPWWMPFSWAVVAVQMSVPGAAAIRCFGVVRGALLTGLLGSLLIPFYEEMAFGANWWRYRACLRLVHTPVYIIVAEALIGVGLAFMGTYALRARSVRGALALGLVAGWVTILGGTIGWGTVEFLGRGAPLLSLPGTHLFGRP